MVSTPSNSTWSNAGDTLTFTATQLSGAALPSWLTIDSQSGVLSGVPSDGDVGTITVQVTATFVTLSGMTAPAQDLDSDGTAEDINGNGRLDFADLVVLFQQRDSPEVQINQADFDFNGNGIMDLADIVTLFETLAA